MAGCPCGCASRPPYVRDPDCARPRRARPAAVRGTYGLSAAELTAEIRRQHAAGWARWELAERFADPRTAHAVAVGVAA